MNILEKIEIPKTIRQKLFVACLVTIAVYNIGKLNEEHIKIQSMRKLIPHQIIGHQLAGLENYTKNIAVMGYFTDASVDDEAQAKLFSYAQYLVTPTILDYNNLNHEYILFVCSNKNIALAIMNRIQAQPFKENEFGMILARRPL